MTVEVSLSGTEMSVLLPGNVNINDFQMPPALDMDDIEIDTLIRPFRPT